MKGKFYALPQSPIIQTIINGCRLRKILSNRKCFRDEDLRADRQMEFTQIDVEMSFIDEERFIK